MSVSWGTSGVRFQSVHVYPENPEEDYILKESKYQESITRSTFTPVLKYVHHLKKKVVSYETEQWNNISNVIMYSWQEPFNRWL